MSWIEIPDGSPFGPDNLPLGVFRYGDEEPRVGLEREGAESGREVGGTELGSAAGAASERRQPDRLAERRGSRR